MVVVVEVVEVVEVCSRSLLAMFTQLPNRDARRTVVEESVKV